MIRKVDREHLYNVLRYGRKNGIWEYAEDTDTECYETLDDSDTDLIADLVETYWIANEVMGDEDDKKS